MSSALTLVVSEVGPADYRTIGEAIKNAQSGTRIFVGVGFYLESLVIDKPLEILGDGPVADIICESEGLPCIRMQTDYAVVRGLTLRHYEGETNNQRSYAVYIPQGRLMLEDCDVTSNVSAFFSSCVFIHSTAADSYIRGCRIHDGAYFGIHVDMEGRATVEDCDIFGNAQSGVYIGHRSKITIRRCKINRNKGEAIFVRTDENVGTVENCDLTGNARGAWGITDSGSVYLYRNGNVE